MKRKKTNNKVPTYKFGLDQAGSLAGILGTTLSATGNDTAGAVGGALSGASAGMALGPIGAVAGGVLGGVTSLLGSSARKKAEALAKRRAQQQLTMNAATANTANIQAEYGQDNPLAYTFANGGMMPGGLAYVDDGEVIQYPNGYTAEVPEQGQSTDQNLTMLPETSTILSDSVKLSELGGKTPAQYYKEKSAKVKYGKDIYSENSAKLNKQNNDKLYNDLLMLQTQDNIKKNRKTNMKSIPKYADGKSLFDYQLRKQWDPRRIVELDGSMDKLLDAEPGYDKLPLSDKLNKVTKLNNLSYKAKYNLEDAGPISPLAPMLDNPPVTSLTPQSYRIKESPATTIKTLPTNFKNAPTVNTKNSNKGTAFNFGAIASLAPVVYNFAQSLRQPELEEPIQNPYASTITSSLAKRRYNINPALQANARNRAIANYNLSQMAPNTGASMAQRVQSALGQYNANMDLYGIQQNANNQYIADYTNMLNNLGQQNVQAQTAAATQNRIAQTKREDYAGAATTQFSKWAQTQQQMTGQKIADAAILPALEKFLSQGYTTKELAAIMSNYQNLK